MLLAANYASCNYMILKLYDGDNQIELEPPNRKAIAKFVGEPHLEYLPPGLCHYVISLENCAYITMQTSAKANIKIMSSWQSAQSIRIAGGHMYIWIMTYATKFGQLQNLRELTLFAEPETYQNLHVATILDACPHLDKLEITTAALLSFTDLENMYGNQHIPDTFYRFKPTTSNGEQVVGNTICFKRRAA